MSNQQTRFAQIGALRRRAPLLALLAVLAPPAVHAQVDIDQDKTPAHIYESDCAVCHKAIRGLANGRSRTALTAYLTEHYTSSDSEAAALAAYVLSGGGGVGSPASGRDLLAAPNMQRNAAGTSSEQRRSQNRLPARERGRRQGRAMKRSAVPQKPAATSGIPASNRGPATATVAPAAPVRPAAPAAGPNEPSAAPVTVQPGEAPSGVSDNIPD
jgi:hypothetical protein